MALVGMRPTTNAVRGHAWFTRDDIVCCLAAVLEFVAHGCSYHRSTPAVAADTFDALQVPLAPLLVSAAAAAGANAHAGGAMAAQEHRIGIVDAAAVEAAVCDLVQSLALALGGDGIKVFLSSTQWFLVSC